LSNCRHSKAVYHENTHRNYSTTTTTTTTTAAAAAATTTTIMA
jgi:hypothetical protein